MAVRAAGQQGHEANSRTVRSSCERGRRAAPGPEEPFRNLQTHATLSGFATFVTEESERHKPHPVLRRLAGDIVGLAPVRGPGSSLCHVEPPTLTSPTWATRAACDQPAVEQASQAARPGLVPLAAVPTPLGKRSSGCSRSAVPPKGDQCVGFHVSA